MRLRFVHTLSALLLSAVLLAVLAMGAVTAWNLDSGFADYLEARDVERLEQFATLVSEVAAQAGSLAALEQRTDLRDLLRQFAQRQGLVARRGPGPDGEGPGPGGAPGRGGPPARGPPPGGADGFGARVMVVGVDDLHLLAMSDLQSLPCRFDDIDAVALARRAGARFQSRASPKGLALSIDTGPLTSLSVHWDGTRIEQLLGNVLENSLRYTDAPGRIVLALKHRGGSVTIDVDDSAPGVPVADLQSLFEPLYRADSARSRHQGGSGLGLAICDAIVRSHDGRIDAALSPLGGLQLHIELPAKAGGLQTSTAPAP